MHIQFGKQPSERGLSLLSNGLEGQGAFSCCLEYCLHGVELCKRYRAGDRCGSVLAGVVGVLLMNMIARWRMVATFRADDNDPKEQFLYQQAGCVEVV